LSWKVLEKKNWLSSAGVVVPLMLGAQIQCAPGIEDRSALQPPPTNPYTVAPGGQGEG